MRAHHLADDRLFDCYTNQRTGEAIDLRVAEHLSECQACQVRYRSLVRLMEELTDHADAELDEVFTVDRLRTQQQQIARKIAHVGRHARVISFPRAAAAVRMPSGSSAHAPSRWMAAAAAAGLFIGVALGVGFEWQRQTRPAPTVAVARPAAQPARLPVVASPAVEVSDRTGVTVDDTFLAELDGALDRPRFAGELQTFDALTPHVREIGYVR